MENLRSLADLLKSKWIRGNLAGRCDGGESEFLLLLGFVGRTSCRESGWEVAKLLPAAAGQSDMAQAGGKIRQAGGSLAQVYGLVKKQLGH